MEVIIVVGLIVINSFTVYSFSTLCLGTGMILGNL